MIRQESCQVGKTRMFRFENCVFATAMAFLLAVPPLHAADWQHVTTADGMPVEMVQFMKRLDGDVWMGTLEGLIRFTGGKPAKALEGTAAWDVLPDGPGRYWVGTANGVSLLADGKGTTSLEGFSVGRLVRFGEKAVWAVAEKDAKMTLMEGLNGVWTPVPRFKGRMVTELLPCRNGTVWALIETDGVVAAEPGKDPATWVHHLKGINVKSLCEDGQGRIWCGTWGRGVMVLEGGSWKTHLAQEKATITAIAQDGEGTLWVATNANGIWRYDGKEWTNHLREEGSINMLERAADGRVYISSQSVPALRVWDGKAWATLLDIPGSFRTVVAGPGDKIWAGHTLTGLYIQP